MWLENDPYSYDSIGGGTKGKQETSTNMSLILNTNETAKMEHKQLQKGKHPECMPTAQKQVIILIALMRRSQFICCDVSIQHIQRTHMMLQHYYAQLNHV